MNTNTETLPSRLREIADAILFGRPSIVARQAADRLNELERELQKERSLADRLAHWLSEMADEFILPAELENAANNAIAAWKEARHE
jgi:hypothetical protein